MYLLKLFFYCMCICTSAHNMFSVNTVQVFDPTNLAMTHSKDMAHIDLAIGSKKWCIFDGSGKSNYTILEHNHAVSSVSGVTTFGDYIKTINWTHGVYLKIFRTVDYSKVDTLSDLISGDFNKGRTYALLAFSPENGNTWAVTSLGVLDKADDPSFVTPQWGFSWIPFRNVDYGWVVSFAIGTHTAYNTLELPFIDDLITSYNVIELQRLAKNVKTASVKADNFIVIPTINPKSNINKQTVPSSISNFIINTYKSGSLKPNQSYNILDNAQLKTFIKNSTSQNIYIYPYLADIDGSNIQTTMPVSGSWALWIAIYNSEGVIQGSYRLSKDTKDFLLPIKEKTLQFQYTTPSDLGAQLINLKYGQVLLVGSNINQSSTNQIKNISDFSVNNTSTSSGFFGE